MEVEHSENILQSHISVEVETGVGMVFRKLL